MDNQEEDHIRKPDKVKKEKLVGNSRHEFEDEFIENECLKDDDYEKAIANSIAEYNNPNNLEELLKISEEDYIFQQIIQQINNEEIEKRSNKLVQFTKRVERLCFTENDKAIRDIIAPIIIDYKSNKINNIELDTEVFNNIYQNFIDSLYQKPISLGKTNTAISKDEDELIRKIFLRKE